MLFYTDGLSEARDADGTDFPLSEGAAHALAEPLASDALDALYARVTEHTGAPLADDVALMLCQPAEPTEGCAVPDPACLAPPKTSSSSTASSASGDG